MLLKSRLSVLLLSAFLTSGLAPAEAAGPFELGLKQYESGRWRHALIYFSLAAEEEPKNTLVHYYLANTLLKAGRREQAIEEYGFCYRLDPHGPAAKYCRQALIAYHEPLPTINYLSEIEPQSGPWQNMYGIAGSGIPGGGPSPGGVSNPLLRAKSQIRREAVYEKSKHRVMGESFASGAMVQAEVEAKRIHEDAEREIEEAMQPQVVGAGKSAKLLPADPVIAKMKIEEIKRLAEERSALARKAAEIKANHYKQWSRERQDAIDDVAGNLENQLEEPIGRNGVKLQAIGTDLYTRYYGTLRASSQMPDVRPVAARITERPIGVRAEQGEFVGADDERRVQEVVRGSVLH